MPAPRRVALAFAGLALLASVSSARADDAEAQFNGSSNPSGQWTYGARNTSDGSFAPLPDARGWPGASAIAVARNVAVVLQKHAPTATGSSSPRA